MKKISDEHAWLLRHVLAGEPEINADAIALIPKLVRAGLLAVIPTMIGVFAARTGLEPDENGVKLVFSLCSGSVNRAKSWRILPTGPDEIVFDAPTPTLQKLLDKRLVVAKQEPGVTIKPPPVLPGGQRRGRPRVAKQKPDVTTMTATKELQVIAMAMTSWATPEERAAPWIQRYLASGAEWANRHEPPK